MKTCLYRPITLNIIAYQIFPQLYDIQPSIDSYIEQAHFNGTLLIDNLTDNTQTTYQYISTINFTDYIGKHIRISNSNQLGNVFVGEWNIEGTPQPSTQFKTAAEAVAGDAVLYDQTNDHLVIVDSADLEPYKEGYSPIGVVVVPGNHDVYGDGSCGVMSLKPMNCSTPSTGGTSEQRMYWGKSGTNISALPNLDKVPIVGSGSNIGNASSTVTGEESYAYLPSDKFSAVQCPHDTDAYYYNSSTYYQIPSPYLTDGSRNPAYYQTTSPSSSSNALADFDGVENTEKITTQRGTKDYNSWKPTYNSQTDYPAASCCDMFYTEGTSQGDWYLPACGELGYITPPFNKINDAIDKMRTAYGSSVGVELNTNYCYWSSTEYNSNGARIMDMNRGQVGSSYKNYVYYVRAFTRVK